MFCARRMAEGLGLLEFVDSQETFEEFIKTVPACDMSFCHWQIQPCQWVATLTGFRDALQASMPENAESAKIFRTADFTFRLNGDEPFLWNNQRFVCRVMSQSLLFLDLRSIEVAGNEGSLSAQTQAYVCFADSSPPMP